MVEIMNDLSRVAQGLESNEQTPVQWCYDENFWRRITEISLDKRKAVQAKWKSTLTSRTCVSNNMVQKRHMQIVPFYSHRSHAYQGCLLDAY